MTNPNLHARTCEGSSTRSPLVEKKYLFTCEDVGGAWYPLASKTIETIESRAHRACFSDYGNYWTIDYGNY